VVLVPALEGSVMKVNVDISVFSSPTSSFAGIWGEIDLPVVPCVGDEMSFLFGEGESMPPVDPSARILVTSRRFDVGRNPSCSIELSGIVADSEHGAELICSYLVVPEEPI
jgi:hypothetical protein